MTTMIIGAGAAGLACAIRIKQNNPSEKVIILERLPSAGQKLLATGNGRCNLSNETAHHKEDVLAFFTSLGLKTRTDEAGRIYPYSLKAQTVVNTLLTACSRLHVDIITDCTVNSVKDGFTLNTSKGILSADRLVVATGGKAQKALGSDGSGYTLLEEFFHTRTALHPALVQLTSSSKYPRILSGTRTKCKMTITLDGIPIRSEYGEVLFANYGLSGIVTLNLSDIVSENFDSASPKKCCAVLDLVPEMSENELICHLNEFGTLSGILGYDLAEVIEKQAQGDFASQAKICKNWQLILTGTKGFDFAQVTKGGMRKEEFNSFASCKAQNLYACGEILDVQFPCGGFNLNFAFFSGICVADQIIGMIK